MKFSAVQAFISKIWLKNSSGAIINPSTSENQDKMLERMDRAAEEGTMVLGDSGVPFMQMENNEMATYDTNLNEVFGSMPLVDDGALKTRSQNQDLVGNLLRFSGANSEAKVLTRGFSTCNIQISGTWAGTLTFEISSNGGDFVAVAGVNAATNTIAYTTTGNGIFRFNVTGINSIKVRFSTFTSGTVIAHFNLSSGPQWQPFAQNTAGAITVTESVLDTNLPFIAPSQMYETGFEFESMRWTEPTIAPTMPTTYAQNKFASFPQKFRRLRTQIAGSQMLPFAQEANTNKMLVSDPELRAVLELMYIELQNIRNVLLGDSSTIN